MSLRQPATTLPPAPGPTHLQQQQQLQAQLLTLVTKCASLLTACDEFLAGADHFLGQERAAAAAGAASTTSGPPDGMRRADAAVKHLLPPYQLLLLKCGQLLETLDRMSLPSPSPSSSSTGLSTSLSASTAALRGGGTSASTGDALGISKSSSLSQALPRATVPLEQLLLAPHQVYAEDPEFIPRALLISALAPDVRAEQESLLIGTSLPPLSALQGDVEAVSQVLESYQAQLLDHLELVQEGKAELEEVWAAEAKAAAASAAAAAASTSTGGSITATAATAASGRQGARSWATIQRRAEVPSTLTATLSFLRAGPQAAKTS